MRAGIPPSPRYLFQITLVLYLLGASTVNGHHVPGHHGSEVAECDCPAGLELVSEPWVRLMPPGMTTTAAYLSVRNSTDEDLRIIAAETPVARRTELHSHFQDASGIMRMREVAEITVPSLGTVDLEPGGLHLMLIDLFEPLESGQLVPITLYVEEHGDLKLQAQVRRAIPADHGDHGHRQGHEH